MPTCGEHPQRAELTYYHRFIETKLLRRLGDTAETLIDVSFTLATNMRLTDAARKGTFRPDLLYRLDVICIQIPPCEAGRRIFRPWQNIS
jgi:transcriptional regulator with PAS, ATPase and Fis domain